MKTYKMFLLLGVIFSCCVVQAETTAPFVIQEKIGRGSFTPESPPVVSYQDSNLTLEPVYDADRISVLIKERDASQLKQLPDRQVTLPDEMAQLNEIRPIYGNKIVAIGLANSAVSVVALIDRKTGLIIDTFYCYTPTISPDGHWIAFQEFFPPHGDEDIRSCYRVYDVLRNASGNRPGQADASEPRLVGFSIYPFGSQSQQEKHGSANKNGEYLMASDTFAWGDKSDQFIFGISEESELILVLVKLNEISKQWQTFTFDLNTDKKVCLENCDLAMIKSLKLGERSIFAQVFRDKPGENPLKLSIPIEKFVRITP